MYRFQSESQFFLGLFLSLKALSEMKIKWRLYQQYFSSVIWRRSKRHPKYALHESMKFSTTEFFFHQNRVLKFQIHS